MSPSDARTFLAQVLVLKRRSAATGVPKCGVATVISLLIGPAPNVVLLRKVESKNAVREMSPPMLWATMSAFTAATFALVLYAAMKLLICASTEGAL